MDDLAMLRTFYEAYGAYFGDDTPVVVTTQGMDATDRATLAGLRAVLASVDTLPKGEDREDGLRAEQG